MTVEDVALGERRMDSMTMIDGEIYYYLSGILTGMLWGAVIGIWAAGDTLSINVPLWLLLSVIATGILISAVHVVGLEWANT